MKNKGHDVTEKLHMGPKRQASGCPLQKAPALESRAWFMILILSNPLSISAVRRQSQLSAESISHRKRELKIRFRKNKKIKPARSLVQEQKNKAGC